MLSAGWQVFGKSVQERNHEILKAAYEILKRRVDHEEDRVELAFSAGPDVFTTPGKHEVCQDSKFDYISVYTKQDGSVRFFGIPSTHSYAAHMWDATSRRPIITDSVEVQFQFDPSNNSYQAVMWQNGQNIGTYGEEDFTVAGASQVYVEGEGKIADVCDTSIRSALQALGQCKEE